MSQPLHILPEGPKPPGFDQRTRWNRYLNILRRKWWLPTLTAAIAFSAAAYYVAKQPVQFFSNGRLWVSGKLRLAEGSLYAEEAQFFFGTQVELLLSEKIQRRAHARVQTLNPEAKPVPVNVHITQTPRTTMFILQAVGGEASYTQAYLNALMDEYLNYKKEVRAGSSDDTLASISEQVYTQQEELKKEQEKLHQFQQSNNVVVLQEQGNTAGNYLSKLNVQLSEIKLEYELLALVTPEQNLDTARKRDETGTSSDPKRLVNSSLPSSGPSADYLTAKQSIELLKSKQAELSRYLRPQHPKILRLNEEIVRGQKLVEVYRQQSQEALATAKESLKLRMKSTEEAIAEQEGRVRDTNRRLVEFDRFKINVQRTQSLYDRLLNLLQSVDVNKNLDQEVVGIMERASPSQPVKPQVTMKMSLALLAGLFVGLGLIYLIERMDDRCTSVREIMERFDEELVGQIPEIPNKKAKGRLALLQPSDERHMFAESYRNIRSSVLFMPTDGTRAKTILVTSAIPNEGKSTVTSNLARTMAFAGSRVLLIDADLRRGSLHTPLELPREPGLTELLRAEVNLSQVVLPTSIPTLFFIPTGKLSNHSGELFLNSAFDQLLKQVHGEYDYILIDSAPVFAADDTTTLAPKMDAVLFVFRGNYTQTRLARGALELLYQRQVNVLGLVFNRADSSDRNYYYYKYGEYYHSSSVA